MKKFALSNLFALALALAVVVLTGMPAAASDAPLVSITGTVVSMTDDVFVLSTDKGNLTFELNKKAPMPAGVVVGNRITVSYESDEDTTDKINARQIVMTPEPAPVPTVVPEPTPAPVPVQAAPAPEVTPQETAPVTQPEEQLPATASPLPLTAIAGLLSLVGGMLLRKRTR